MRPSAFAHHRPTSVKEAISLLAQFGRVAEMPHLSSLRTQPAPAELSLRFALDLATGSAAVLDTGSRAAKKMPRVSGAEYFGGTSDDRICGTIDKCESSSATASAM